MITSNLLASLFPYTSARLRDRFIAALNKYLPLYEIDTPKRIAAFIATGGVETDYLRVTIEYASGVDYEGRTSLGNTHEGDGRKFKGRGFFQTTGRYNYSRLNQTIGKKLGIDFLRNPERLAEIDVAVESACIFWRDNDLAKYADAGEFKKLSSVVNCGNPNKTPNHWDKRNALYKLCVNNIKQEHSEFAPKQNPVVTKINVNGSSYTTQEPIIVPNSPSAARIPPPPTRPAPSKTDVNADALDLKDFSKKYLVHTPFDSLKNILLVVVSRIIAIITTLWGIGLHGRVLVFVVAFAAIVPLVWAIVKYRSRLFGWGKDIVDSFLGN